MARRMTGTSTKVSGPAVRRQPEGTEPAGDRIAFQAPSKSNSSNCQEFSQSMGIVAQRVANKVKQSMSDVSNAAKARMAELEAVENSLESLSLLQDKREVSDWQLIVLIIHSAQHLPIYINCDAM